MGTDIHVYAEVRRGEKWEKAGKVFPNPYHDPTKPVETYEDGDTWNEPLIDDPLYMMSYDTFSILADVRNGTGFAGSTTGTGFIPISQPRGLPEDVTEEVKRSADAWGTDGHSHSWLTLGDLLRYDWNQTTTHCGWVDAGEYAQFRKDGYPQSSCAGVSGSGIRKLSNAEMDRAIAKGDTAEAYTLVEWEESYVDCARRLWDVTIPALAGLIAPGTNEDVSLFLDAVKRGDTLAALAMGDWLQERGLPELNDVRIVFWFDS